MQRHTSKLYTLLEQAMIHCTKKHICLLAKARLEINTMNNLPHTMMLVIAEVKHNTPVTETRRSNNIYQQQSIDELLKLHKRIVYRKFLLGLLAVHVCLCLMKCWRHNEIYNSNLNAGDQRVSSGGIGTSERRASMLTSA